MTHKLILILWLCLLVLEVHAQLPGVPPTGPITAGLGGISSGLDNAWAIFNNPAGLSSQEHLSLILGYQTLLNFKPFNTATAAVVLPTKFGVTAFSVYKFGDDLFSNQMASVAFAKKLGIMSLGIKAGILQYNIQGFGKQSVFIADIGGLAELTPTLAFGMHIYNFSQTIIASESQEKVPTVIRLSLNYRPSDQLKIFIEGEKDIDLTPDINFGISYRIIEGLTVRTGFSTLSNSHSFGGGFHFKRFIIDYAIRANSDLGSTHNFGLTYALNEK